jgi:hypothetical protein
MSEALSRPPSCSSFGVTGSMIGILLFCCGKEAVFSACCFFCSTGCGFFTGFD